MSCLNRRVFCFTALKLVSDINYVIIQEFDNSFDNFNSKSSNFELNSEKFACKHLKAVLYFWDILYVFIYLYTTTGCLST